MKKTSIGIFLFLILVISILPVVGENVNYKKTNEQLYKNDLLDGGWTEECKTFITTVGIADLEAATVKINIEPYSIIYEGDVINCTITGNPNVFYWKINNL